MKFLFFTLIQPLKYFLKVLISVGKLIFKSMTNCILIQRSCARFRLDHFKSNDFNIIDIKFLHSFNLLYFFFLNILNWQIKSKGKLIFTSSSSEALSVHAFGVILVISKSSSATGAFTCSN